MLSRRAIIEGAAGIAALALLGGGARALAGEGGLLRPPGAQDEAALLGACLRCDRCRSVCATDAIDLAVVEDGLLQVSTPKMNFRLGYCNECDGAWKCRTACPTAAIGAFDKTTQRLGLAVVDPEVCLTYGISGFCSGKCIDPCPEDALFFNDAGRLEVRNELCWGCGACEYFCISDSYGAYSGSIRRGINIEPVTTFTKEA